MDRQGVTATSGSEYAPPPAQVRRIQAEVVVKTPVPRALLSIPLAGPAPSGSTAHPGCVSANPALPGVVLEGGVRVPT